MCTQQMMMGPDDAAPAIVVAAEAEVMIRKF
jgi:hypothetical protein